MKTVQHDKTSKCLGIWYLGNIICFPLRSASVMNHLQITLFIKYTPIGASVFIVRIIDACDGIPTHHYSRAYCYSLYPLSSKTQNIYLTLVYYWLYTCGGESTFKTLGYMVKRFGKKLYCSYTRGVAFLSNIHIIIYLYCDLSIDIKAYDYCV